MRLKYSAIILASIGFLAAGCNKPATQSITPPPAQEPVPPSADQNAKGTAQVSPPPAPQPQSRQPAPQPAPQPGSYADYSSATVSNEQRAGNKVVLFFHAPWCPFCRAADTAFKDMLGQIPAGVTVLKTDYDSNTELKKKYGVTYQHTFVQIDASGNAVSKWNGGDVDNLKKYLK